MEKVGALDTVQSEPKNETIARKAVAPSKRNGVTFSQEDSEHQENDQLSERKESHSKASVRPEEALPEGQTIQQSSERSRKHQVSEGWACSVLYTADTESGLPRHSLAWSADCGS